MGQYHYTVNLDAKEFIDPHQLGAGLKLWEQIAHSPGVGAALIILLAASNGRGGGDLDEQGENLHGRERDPFGPIPALSEEYSEVAKRTIGRWKGQRIAVVGDYAEDFDLPDEFEASTIYTLCSDGDWKDITPDVARVIEHELSGDFVGTGWKDWVPAERKQAY